MSEPRRDKGALSEESVREVMLSVEKWTGKKLPAEALCVVPGAVEGIWNCFLIREKRWRGLERGRRLRVAKADFEECVRGNVPPDVGGPGESETVYQWGMRCSCAWVDAVGGKLGYLAQCGYADVVVDAQRLMDEVMRRDGGWNVVGNLVREVRMSGELAPASQFTTNRMIEYCERLDEAPKFTLDGVVDYVMMYRAFLEYYLRDMVFLYCLVRWVVGGEKLSYLELAKAKRGARDHVDPVVGWAPSLGRGYVSKIANACRHERFHVEEEGGVVVFQEPDKPVVELTFDEMLIRTREISAAAWVLRFLAVVWARSCWKDIASKLEGGREAWVWPVSEGFEAPGRYI